MSQRPPYLVLGVGAFAVVLLLFVPSLVGDGKKPGVLDPLTKAAIHRMKSGANAGGSDGSTPDPAESMNAPSGQSSAWSKQADNATDVSADAVGEATADTAPQSDTAEPAAASADDTIDVGPIHK